MSNKRTRILRIVKYQEKGRISDDGFTEDFDFENGDVLSVVGLKNTARNYSVTYIYNNSFIIKSEV